MTVDEADAAVAELPPQDQDDDHDHDHDHGPLPPEQVAALRLADVLTEPRATPVDEGLMAELRANFTPGQILELATALSVASGWQRFIEAFGIRPDHWTEATPIPARPNGDAA
jgi:alkylhydroperoxidase family enzyme